MTFFWKKAGQAVKGTLGVRPAMPFIGGAAGGIYGAATSENLTGENVLRDAMMGGAVGFGAGSLFTKTFARGVKGLGKGTWKKVRPLFTEQGGIKAQEKIERMVLGGASFLASAGKSALQHPVTALAIGGGAYGIGAMGIHAMMAQKNVPMTPTEYMNQNRLPSTGFDPSRGDLHQSTFGLVQGLFKGRHGG